MDSLLKVGSGPEQRAIIEARYGLDRPLPVQYFIWLRKVLTCDLGTAIVGKRPVIDLVLQALPYSLALAD